jgi:hypothetical protein
LHSSAPLDISSSLSKQFRLFLSLFVSHISGWWPMVVVVVSGWWWLWWGGWFPRAYTAPYLSFLSLWEGEEGPRSRALRTEFIIDRAICLTAPRSVLNGGGIIQTLSISPVSVVSVRRRTKERRELTKVCDLLFAFLD